MKQHRFSKSEILQMMRDVDPDPRVPVQIIFMLALAKLFRARGIAFTWIQNGPDIKLDGPSKWWREKGPTDDLIVEQGT